ncbi:MAG TPA: NmrA family NAD(P)-binding protein [Flavitalea sp.]|nr:NmrA family NAD(P)-binding protein [Flavitalea sp.]
MSKVFSLNNDQHPAEILLLGGKGKTGKKIADRLSRLGQPYRYSSRQGQPRFEWEDQSTWRSVLKNSNSVYIAYQPDLAAPGAVQKIDELTKLAVSEGVSKLVLLSGRGEQEAEECEKIVMGSGIDWTILRCSWFNQNFSEGYLLEPLQQNYVALPVPNVSEPFVDTDDIADVAVAALMGSEHVGQLYELTGPDLLTFEEAVKIISEALGREVVYEKVSFEDYSSALLTYGVPPELIDLLKYLFITVLDGRNESVTDGVEKALGRKPKAFAQFVKESISVGVWNVLQETY